MPAFRLPAYRDRVGNYGLLRIGKAARRGSVGQGERARTKITASEGNKRAARGDAARQLRAVLGGDCISLAIIGKSPESWSGRLANADPLVEISNWLTSGARDIVGRGNHREPDSVWILAEIGAS